MVCERMSHTTSSPDIRASWLRLAESWLRMVPHESAFTEETFDSAREGRGEADSKHPH